MRKINLPPDPSSLMESMRDIGYSMGTALADLIDNSITAAASNIKILADTHGPEPKVGVLDDGTGMSAEELIQAMRLGSRSPLTERSSFDLGRFGLGLKTASLSQCRAMTVISRQHGVTSGAKWDLDFVRETGQWDVQIIDDHASVPWSEQLETHGTLVLWERLDTQHGGLLHDLSADDLVRQLGDAQTHLELTFHRFLGNDRAARNFKLFLNGRELRPFDPFNSSHYATQMGPEERVRLDGHDIVVQPFTLPHHSKVSPAEWDLYGREEGYLKNQGFYVYRERRLIIHGTWFSLARQTELGKLTRVRVDMPNSLDHAWRIDVKKSRVELPPLVRRRLRTIVERIVTPSKRIYTQRGKQLAEDSRIPLWTRIQDKGVISYHVNTEHPSLTSFQSTLEPELRNSFLRIVEMAGASLPLDALMADFSSDPNSLTGTASAEALSYFVSTTFEALKGSGHSLDDIKDMMQMAEPFRSNWEATLRIMHQLAENGE